MVIFRSLFFFIFLLNSTSAFALSPQETLSSQKRLYKAALWDQFFAQAIYYRLKIDESHSSKNEVYDHIVALEILALPRHCQWASLAVIDDKALPNYNELTQPLKSKTEETSWKVGSKENSPTHKIYVTYTNLDELKTMGLEYINNLELIYE